MTLLAMLGGRNFAERAAGFLVAALVVAFVFDAQGLVGPGGVRASIAMTVSYVAAISFATDLDPRRLTGSEVWLALFVLHLAAAGLLAAFASGRSWSLRPEHVPPLGAPRHVYHAGRWFVIVIFVVAVRQVLTRCPKLLRRVETGMWWAAAIVGIFGTYQLVGYYLGWPFTNINNLHKVGQHPLVGGTVLRMFATFAEPKIYGIFLVFLIPSLVGYVVSRGPSGVGGLWKRALVVLLCGHFLMTFSMGSYLAVLIVSGLGIVVLRPWSHPPLRRLAVGLAVVLMAAGTALGGEIHDVASQTWNRLSVITSLDFAYQSTAGITFVQLERAFKLALDNPLFGMGPGGFYEQAVAEGWRNWRGQIIGPKSHVAYLLASGGLLSVVLFYLYPLTLLSQAVKILRHSAANQSPFATRLRFHLVAGAAVTTQMAVQGGVNRMFVWFLYALIAAQTSLLQDRNEVRVSTGSHA